MSSSQGRSGGSPQRRDSSPRSEGMSAMAYASAFEVKTYPFGRRVRCKNNDNDWTVIERMEHLPGLAEAQDLVPLFGIEREMAKAGAKNWTTFFLRHGIWLSGSLDCANLLKDREPDAAVYVIANRPFPYCQSEDRVVKGTIQGEIGGQSWITSVHLDNTKGEISLQANRMYFISGDVNLYADFPRSCVLCRGEHDIRNVPCAQVLSFMSTDHSRCAPKAVDVHWTGDPVLTISQGTSKLRSAGLGYSLCDDCKDRVAEEGNMWFLLDGSCEDRECINFATCNCIEDTVDCKDYVYVEGCTRNNLASNNIATAIADGTVQTVRGTMWKSNNIRMSASLIKSLISGAMKSGKQISIADVAEKSGYYEEEILGLAMYDQKLGDYIKGNKCFTLSIVNGYVENAVRRRVGPWLVGRISEDKRGQMWHVPKRQTVVIETKDGISHIRRSELGIVQKSDALGDFVAGLGNQ